MLDKSYLQLQNGWMSFAERFLEEGWLQVDSLFPVKLIDDLREEFGSQLAALTSQTGNDRDYLNVGHERMMLSVALRGPFLNPTLFAHPVLLRILRHFLGGDMVIDSLTCVVAMSGAGDQVAHRDHGELFHEAPALSDQLPPYAITLVVPLIDLTPETGTTRLLPGTHQRRTAREHALPYIPRGSCFMMDYRIEHHGTANRSLKDRPVLYLVFSRPWFTDIRNFRRQPRMNIALSDLRRIPAEHSSLFRRLAAKGGIDLTEKELFPAE